MKKTHNISIGGSLFNIEEDAFLELEKYIASIRHYFDDNPEKENIIEDIETGIAEKFTENNGHIIKLKDVEAVIGVMGKAEQFDADKIEYENFGEKSEDNNSHLHHTVKRLYRDGDDKIVAGVCSGLGHFFGVDANIIRLIFMLSVLLGGSGFVVYFLLWIFIPKAKTATQKLHMKGTPVTISAMSDMIKEKFEEMNTKEGSNIFTKILLVPIHALKALLKMLD